MLKILVISVLIFYTIYKISGILSRITGRTNDRQRPSESKEGHVRVDTKPGTDQKGYEGGEYVDYEEVK